MENDSWYCITLNQDQVMAGFERKIQDAFASRYLAAGCPQGVALLDNSNPKPFTQPSLDCHLYFTPTAAVVFPDLIRQYQAYQCAEPPIYSTYLVGDEAFLSEARQRASERKEENS